MRAKNVNEDINFERGQNPKATMELGGVNYQGEFDKLFDVWMKELKKLKGKTITGDINKHWMDSNYSMQDDLRKRSVKVNEIDNFPHVHSTGGGRAVSWMIFFDGEEEGKKFRYSMLLNQKLYVE